MPLLAQSLDYTDRDFDALRARLIALVRSAFPDWTDFDVASFGTILIEMFAFVGDVLTYYQDNLARESRLVTATQRRSVIALAKMLGYRLHGAKAASVQVELSMSDAAAGDVVVPAGTVIRTKEVTEPIRFTLTSDVTILAGQRTFSGLAEHAMPRRQLYDARGLPNLDLPLNFGPYLDASARVSTPQGAFVEVENFLGSGPNDRHFVVAVDQNDRATVRFGDGRCGLPPSGTITALYKTGGGAAGNVESGRLVVVEGSFKDAFGRPVQVTARNSAPASGGTDRQTVASAKLLAPESLRVLTRTVSREDFEINARRLPGVARALMLTRNEDRSVRENAGILYVVPKGGGPPSPALKDEVRRQVTEVFPCTLTFQVDVQDPVYQAIDVAARVYVRPGEPKALVAKRLRDGLDAFFRISEPDGTPNPNVDFGFNVKGDDGAPAAEVAWSDVLNVVRDTPGVRKVGDGRQDCTLNGRPEDVLLGVREFPVLGTVTLLDGETGLPL